MTNEILVEGAVSTALKKKVRLLAGKILESSGIRRKSLDVIFLSNRRMRFLKNKFLPGRKGPANTLSFRETGKFCHPEVKYPYLGEIYVNLDLTKGKMVSIKPLLIHSILHILGYGHREGRDTIKMDRKARKLMKINLFQCLKS